MGDSTLNELQQRLVHQTSLFKNAVQQSRVTETTAKRCRLTLKELQHVDASTHCYEGVGRAYFLQPKSDLEKGLSETEAACTRQQAELAKSREKHQKDVQAVETEIRELIAAEPKLAQQFLEA